MTETFGDLLANAAHWEFEIFLMLLFDGLIIGVGWKFVRKHWAHHIARDERETVQDWSMNPVSKDAGHVVKQKCWAESWYQHGMAAEEVKRRAARCVDCSQSSFGKCDWHRGEIRKKNC